MKTCAQCRINYPDALDVCPRDGSLLPAPAGRTQALYDALIGSTVDGRYCIEAKLGEGGMGVVYAARHVIIDKRVAMKVLKAEAQEDPTAGQRFIQEAKSASKIRHANIVDITDFGMLPDGSAYFVMEFLEGHTLGDVIRQGPMPALRVISIAAQVARGLHAAHSKGIIHRDLKPENVFLLEREGVPDCVKIVDFGIAKMQEGGALGLAGQRLTQAGMVLGTPEYMSPEQATGKESDHRVDEYALGCIMYEMLTGDVPYRGETSAGTLTKHVFDPIVSPRKKRPELNIPIALDAVVVKAMAKSADDRYPGMKELLDALDHASMEIETGRDAMKQANLVAETSRATVVGPQLSAGESKALKVRGSRLPMILGGVGVVVILGGAGVYGILRAGGTSEAANKVGDPAVARAAVVAPPAVPDIPRRPTRVEVTLRSVPEGAEIWQGGEMVGEAPHTIALDSGSAPVEFTFRKHGYDEQQRRVVPDKDQVIDVMLSQARSSARKGSSSSRSSSLRLNVKTSRPSGGSVPQSDLRDPFKAN